MNGLVNRWDMLGTHDLIIKHLFQPEKIRLFIEEKPEYQEEQKKQSILRKIIMLHRSKSGALDIHIKQQSNIHELASGETGR